MIAWLQRWLLFPSVVMAASAVGWSLSTERLLALRHDPIANALVFTLALLFYNRDRLAGYGRADDRLNTAERAAWISAHQVGLRRLVAAATVVSALFLFRRPAALPPILAGLGFALVYAVRLLPGNRAPKQLPGLKAPYVAALWVLLVVGVPLAAARRGFDGRAALLAGALFSLVAAQITVNDIRDIPGDRLVGTRSLATLLGERGARLVALAFAGGAAACATALRSPGLLLSAGYAAVYAVTYRPRADRAYRWIIEGAGVFTWLAVRGSARRLGRDAAGRWPTPRRAAAR